VAGAGLALLVVMACQVGEGPPGEGGGASLADAPPPPPSSSPPFAPLAAPVLATSAIGDLSFPDGRQSLFGVFSANASDLDGDGRDDILAVTHGDPAAVVHIIYLQVGRVM
jgi:hypothetical protein